MRRRQGKKLKYRLLEYLATNPTGLAKSDCNTAQIQAGMITPDATKNSTSAYLIVRYVQFLNHVGRIVGLLCAAG